MLASLDLISADITMRRPRGEDNEICIVEGS